MCYACICVFLTIAPSGSVVERGVSLVISCIDIALVFVKQKSLDTLGMGRRGCVWWEGEMERVCVVGEGMGLR